MQSEMSYGVLLILTVLALFLILDITSITYQDLLFFLFGVLIMGGLLTLDIPLPR